MNSISFSVPANRHDQYQALLDLASERTTVAQTRWGKEGDRIVTLVDDGPITPSGDIFFCGSDQLDDVMPRRCGGWRLPGVPALAHE